MHTSNILTIIVCIIAELVERRNRNCRIVGLNLEWPIFVFLSVLRAVFKGSVYYGDIIADIKSCLVSIIANSEI